MGLIDFFASLFFFVWFTSGIFWAMAAAAFASWARIDFKIAIPAGLVFQWLGFIGLGIYYLVRRTNQNPNKFAAANNYSTASQFAANDPFGGSMADAFATPAPTFGGSGFESNPFASAASYKPKSNSWIKTLAGGFVVFGSIVVIAAFVWSLFLTWFNITTSSRNSQGINALSTGFDFWIFITAGLIIAAIILSIKHPSLIAAVLLAMAGTWWLMLSTASLTARDVFVQSVDNLFQIPNLVTSSSGYTATWAFDVGAAWYVVFFNSIILIVASAWMIAVANRERGKHQ